MKKHPDWGKIIDWRLGAIAFFVTLGVASLAMWWVGRSPTLAQEGDGSFSWRQGEKSHPTASVKEGAGQPVANQETQCPNCQIWNGTKCVPDPACYCCDDVLKAPTTTLPSSATVVTEPLQAGDCPPDSCGKVVLDVGRTLDVQVKQSGCNWIFGITLKVSVRSGVCSAYFTDICSGNSPAVTKDNFCFLATNFNAGCCYSASPDFPSPFGCSDCVTIHEQTHVSDFQSCLQKAFTMDLYLDLLPLAVSCPYYKTADQAKTFRMPSINQDVKDAIEHALVCADKIGETNANAATVACEQAVAKSICARASSAGWGACPACP